MQITFWWQPGGLETHFEVFGWGLIESWELTKILFVLQGILFLLSWLFLLFSWVLFFLRSKNIADGWHPGVRRHNLSRTRHCVTERGAPREWLTTARKLSLWARSIQPNFPEISVQNSMDRFGPTGKVSKKRVHLLRWSSFFGRTGLNFGRMDRALYL